MIRITEAGYTIILFIGEIASANSTIIWIEVNAVGFENNNPVEIPAHDLNHGLGY